MLKTAMVTGASEGLGRQFSLQLAASGYQTINIAWNEQRLKELVAESGKNHQYLVADLNEASGIAACIELMKKHHIHVFINNAGTVVSASLKACHKRKGPIVIPGLHNRLIVLVLRAIPRKAVVWAMGKIGELT